MESEPPSGQGAWEYIAGQQQTLSCPYPAEPAATSLVAGSKAPSLLSFLATAACTNFHAAVVAAPQVPLEQREVGEPLRTPIQVGVVVPVGVQGQLGTVLVFSAHVGEAEGTLGSAFPYDLAAPAYLFPHDGERALLQQQWDHTHLPSALALAGVDRPQEVLRAALQVDWQAVEALGRGARYCLSLLSKDDGGFEQALLDAQYVDQDSLLQGIEALTMIAEEGCLWSEGFRSSQDARLVDRRME